jgi:hypothetical protein
MCRSHDFVNRWRAVDEGDKIVVYENVAIGGSTMWVERCRIPMVSALWLARDMLSHFGQRAAMNTVRPRPIDRDAQAAMDGG